MARKSQIGVSSTLNYTCVNLWMNIIMIFLMSVAMTKVSPLQYEFILYQVVL